MDASQAFVCALLKRTSCVCRNFGAEDPSVVVGWAGHCGRGLCSANKSWAAQKSVIAASNASSSSLSSSAAAATPPALPDLTQRVDIWLDPPTTPPHVDPFCSWNETKNRDAIFSSVVVVSIRCCCWCCYILDWKIVSHVFTSSPSSLLMLIQPLPFPGMGRSIFTSDSVKFCSLGVAVVVLVVLRLLLLPKLYLNDAAFTKSINVTKNVNRLCLF